MFWYAFVRRAAFFAAFLLFCICQTATAQNSTRADSSSEVKAKRSLNIVALPLVFYSPETRWGFGAGGVAAFRFKGEADSTLASQVTLGFAYTQEKQILAYIPWRLYWKNEKFLSYGEVGYYKYNYFYFGVGNDNPLSYQEKYDVRFPRVQLNFLRRVKGDLYMGLRYWLDDFRISELDPAGELNSGRITGAEGGLVSSVGLVSNYDGRDNVFFPSKGLFVESALLFNYPWTGSDFSFTRFSLDVAKYFELPWEHIVAVNAFTDLTFGDPPFNQMAQLGGTKKMRGFYQGRYRDNKAWILQGEYRAPLFWRLGAVAFGSWGAVSEGFSDLSIGDSRFTYGAGLRLMLSKEEKINVRIDYGHGKGGGGWYLTFGEAF